MSLSVMATSQYSKITTGSTKQATKPTWNPNKSYKYLEDFGEAAKSYKNQAVSYYRSMISREPGDGTLSVDELKAQIKELFPEYTLTNREPKDVTAGTDYLYIDDKNLEKLASDPEYRAKVYGLMDSELYIGKKGYTLEYSDGRDVTAHLIGSVFSLAETNQKYAGADGIPYLGSCMSDQPFSSSDSHAQVRNMSFLYDNLDPAKSAANDRKANAVKSASETLAEKRTQKRKEQKKAAKEALEKKREEKLDEKKQQEKLQAAAAQMISGSKYKGADDIAVQSFDYTEESVPKFSNIKDLTSWISDNYENYRNGTVTISKSFLRQCLDDEEKMQKLTDLLNQSEEMVKDAEENLKGYIGMEISIDEDGNMETTSYSGSVMFNEGKRSAQISASKHMTDINYVMDLLAEDLADCEAGLEKGFCDQAEVDKVKSAIQKAQQKAGELSVQEKVNGDDKEGQEQVTVDFLM